MTKELKEIMSKKLKGSISIKSHEINSTNENRNEIIQPDEQKEKRMNKSKQNINELWNTIHHTKIHMGVQEGEGKGYKEYLKKQQPRGGSRNKSIEVLYATEVRL